jgi:ribosomal-protein-alanine N-acetyltransferase
MIPCSSSSFNSIAAAKESMFKNSSSHSRSVYAAYLKDTDVFVGIMTLKRYDARNRRAEIDYIVAEEHQRKGFASEMLKLFLEDVFQEWRLERISAFVFLESEPSCKLLEKLNFNIERFSS